MERDDRLEKLKELRKKGIDPYPSKAKRTHIINKVLVNFKKLEKSKKQITITGRLRSKREFGNLTFAHLQDSSGQIQIAFSKKDIGVDLYKNFVKLIDIGDFIEVSGYCFLTHKGERSVMVKDWKILAKALRPLPEKWHGLKDEEERFRKRYLDILFNSEVRDMVEKRSKFWQAMREFMLSKGFLEVETPVLEVMPGGADARPFITHHNALDMDVYLRISMGELWQKRLMIAGFEKPTEGKILFQGEEVEGPGPERTVVFQDGTLFPWMTVIQNIEFGLKAQHIPKSEVKKITRRCLSLVGLDEFGHMRPHELSGGMKQRLALAVALISNPPILMLDEPTSNLDPGGRDDFISLLNDLKAKGKTILFSSHRYEEVESLADRILVLERGELIADCAPEAFRRHLRIQTHLRLYVGHDQVPEALALLRRQGLEAYPNGRGIQLELAPEEMVIPFRVLSDAGIRLLDFNLIQDWKEQHGKA